MPLYEWGETTIHYEDHGSGFPVLLLAPGGMDSTIARWQATPWNPIEQLADHHRVIAMDQRNAGGSRAPISAGDGWSSYAADQLGLMDHLGIDRFHAAGMCIGGPYALGLARRAPQRVASATLFQPIGLEEDGSNKDAFLGMFDDWAERLKPERDADEAAWNGFRENMFGVDEVLFDVDEGFLAACETPLLVLEGDDAYHPRSVSRLIAETAADVTYIETWKEGADREAAMERFDVFLATHTPDA